MMLCSYLVRTLEFMSWSCFISLLHAFQMIKADLNFSLQGKLHLLHGRITRLIANINIIFVSQEATKNFYHNLINMNQAIVNSERKESWVLLSSIYTHHQQFGPPISVLYFGMINCLSPIAHFCIEWEILEHCKYGSFYWVRGFYPIFHIQLDSFYALEIRNYVFLYS